MAKKKWRKEKDSLGTIDVPGDKYWGAQTQRALKHFSSAFLNQIVNFVKDVLSIAHLITLP